MHRLIPHRLTLCTLLCVTAFAAAQAPQRTFTRADILRGSYGPYRANNDLLSYDLNVRVDPEKKFISGKNAIRFRMLKDDVRIQLDLFADLAVDKILLGSIPLKYEREFNAVFVDFPETLKKDTGQNLTPIFDQYLRHSDLPTLELKFQGSAGNVSYRWKVDVKDFAMPVKVGRRDDWQLIRPTTEWKTMKWGTKKDDCEVATDLFYVNVVKM